MSEIYVELFLEDNLIMSNYPTYDGPTTVTPSDQEQVLPTDNTTVYDDITVEAAPLQAKTGITPTESSQTIEPDVDYYGLSSVQIDAVDDEYVGSAVKRRDSTDLDVIDDTVNVMPGFYKYGATATVASGSASTPATTITANPSISVSSSGLITATASASQSITPAVSAGYVSAGTSGTITVSGSSTSQLTTQGATTVTPSETTQSVASADTYLTGAITVDPIPSEYIVPTGTISITSNGSGIDVSQYAAADVSVQAPVLQTVTKTYVPTESQQTETITAGTGYDALEEVDVTVNAIPSTYVGSGVTQRSSSDLSASGATVTVPAGYYASNASKAVASGSVTAPPMIMGVGATVSTGTNQLILTGSVSVTPYVTTPGYVNTGTPGTASATLSATVFVDPTPVASGDTVAIPAGYYSTAKTKSVASGTAGTPIATKGAVANHSVTITPSVTNTTGYITGSTKTGTAVTVSASELVSGSETKTVNGTYDVTNLAELVVNVSGGGGATNLVQGTFNLSGLGAKSISLPYVGNGYPIAMVIVAHDGINNPSGAWYTGNYDTVGQYTYTKADMTTTPTWGVDDRNKGCVLTISGYGSSMYHTIGLGGYTLRGGAAKGSYEECVRFISSTELSVYMKNTPLSSDVGFRAGIDYDYWIIYSS